MKRVDPVVATTQTPTPILNNEMASYEEVDFYTLDSFHKCFYDVSTCNNGVVLSRKLPPDKVKVKLLATTAYLMTLIICILIPTTNYNGVPVFWSSSVKAGTQFPSFDVLQESHVYDVPHFYPSSGCGNDVDGFLLTYNSSDLDETDWDYFRCDSLIPAVLDVLINVWTNGLDLMYPPSSPSLTWMNTPVENDQMIPNCIQSSQFSQDVRPGNLYRSSLTLD